MAEPDRPIIFSAPMVRAILAGRKTQTRRLPRRTDSGRVKEVGGSRNWHIGDPDAVLACPYGVRGDRLWVRETWCPEYKAEGSYLYRATCSNEVIFQDGGHWRPPIFMPRRACRLVLEVTDVRVQRLQEISEEDAQAEGVGLMSPCTHPDCRGRCGRCAADSYRGAYAVLWDAISAKRAPWGSNPWVWAITFERSRREDSHD